MGKAKVRRKAEAARFDRWVASLGGYGSERYAALLGEAYEFAGPDGLVSYLEMAREIDAAHEAHKRDRAARGLAIVRAEAARRAGNAAASATLRRCNEIRLAADVLLADPRLADAADFTTRAGMTRAEIDAELRAAMGLAARAPSAYETQMPPVGDLARAIGLRP
jgi:hypothetical protein